MGFNFRDSGRSSNWYGCLFAVVVVLIIIGAVGEEPISEHLNVHPVTGTVVDTYVKRIGESDIFFAAIKQDSGEVLVVQNHDAWTWGKFNSADVQQQLIVAQNSGQKVTLTVTGWRVPLFSWFENIVQASIPTQK